MTPLKHSMPLVNSSDHIPKLYLIDNHILYNSDDYTGLSKSNL